MGRAKKPVRVEFEPCPCTERDNRADLGEESCSLCHGDGLVPILAMPDVEAS